MLRISYCLDNRLTDGGKVVSPTHPPHFTPQKHYYFSVSGSHFCWRLSKPQGLVRPQGLSKLKKFIQLIRVKWDYKKMFLLSVKFCPNTIASLSSSFIEMHSAKPLENSVYTAVAESVQRPATRLGVYSPQKRFLSPSQRPDLSRTHLASGPVGTGTSFSEG
jgi:hypothetical protein